MAEPILLEIAPRDIRRELAARIESAPVEHAEAILEGYEVLQALHDAGILNLLRGVLGSGNDVLEDVVEASNKEGSLRAIRNLVTLLKVAESIDPDELHKFAAAVPLVVDAVYKAHQAEPPSLLQSIGIAKGANVRRGLAAINGALQALRTSLTSTEVPKATNG